MKNENKYVNRRGNVDYYSCYYGVERELLTIYETVTGKRYKYDGAHKVNEETLHNLLKESWAVLMPKIREQRAKQQEEFEKKYGDA